MKKYFLTLFIVLSSPAHAQIECIEANINDHYLVAGRTTTVLSKHHYIITNTTPTSATYTHTLYLCPDDQECEIRTRSKTLSPGERFDFRTQVKSDVRYGKQGNRGVMAHTIISGAETATVSKRAYLFVRQ